MAIRELDYFPPKGSKYEWHPPILRNGAWSCYIQTASKGRNEWGIKLNVWLNGANEYCGFAEIKTLHGPYVSAQILRVKHPLEALLATEALGELLLKAERDHTPPWALEALALGWRPPMQQGYV